MSKILNINIPNKATKQLKFQECKTGKKLVVSTNFLPLFGFNKDAKVVEELIGYGMGIRVRLANSKDLKVKKVYSREYKSRKNNPLETLLDIRGQKLLNEAFASNISTVHILFSHGEILITPITNIKAQIIKKFKDTSEPLKTFLAASSGVDGYSLSKKGFSIETLLEFRPNEKRDKQDFTETGAINAMANFPINTVINEDIMDIDIERVAALSMSSNHTLFHFSLQCDDFSNVKAKKLKNASLEDSTTTIDMILDGISLIKKFKFPVVMLENVRGFADSDIGKMTVARLKRLGYTIYDKICDARDFGGLTSRIRYYLVATMLPVAFVLPKKQERNTESIWKHIQPLINEGHFRIPKSTKSFEKGIECGRSRTISTTSISVPTILKSQNRMAKDSVFALDDNGTMWFPKESALKSLMGIDKQFSLEAVGETIASEIIGQSIEAPLHDAWIDAVKQHINSAHALLNNRLF